MDGPYYQLSANDVGSRICIKCTLDEAALSTPGAGVSPSRRRGPDAVQAPSPTRLQTQVAFAEVRCHSGRLRVPFGILETWLNTFYPTSTMSKGNYYLFLTAVSGLGLYERVVAVASLPLRRICLAYITSKYSMCFLFSFKCRKRLFRTV